MRQAARTACIALLGLVLLAVPIVLLAAPTPAVAFHIPQRAITYQRLGYALGFFGIFWHGLGLWLILHFGIAAQLRCWAYRLTTRQPHSEKPPPLRALALFYVAFSLLFLLWQMPLGMAGLLLEKQFGFAREGWGRWLEDTALSWVLSLPLILVLWLGYVVYFRSPQRWWLWLWAALTPLILFNNVIQPIFIAPLFNRYRPLPPGPLRQAIENLAAKAHIRHAVILVENTSRRTTHVNAYVTGIGPTTRIVIDDTALKTLPPDQLLVMVAHEMGHYVEKHVWIITLSNILGAGVLLWVLSKALPTLLQRFARKWGIESPADLAALPALFLCLYVLLQIQMPLANLESRYLEHRADAFALRLTHLNRAMAQLFIGFAERDYEDPNPPALIQWWYGTHPSLRSRVQFALSYHPWRHGAARYR
ncbi:Zn-dependent protease with chaperone function [Chthonomonas calidirosea]|uniref:M48 family metallopeptidase n=1 Tax=Chthonomonas calidirosea TaxID=454171 RepID=UPI0006DD5287|nr:M48 family metallopeptidase [Chthonomonas calidirosea]CEK12802.1 Zn-dependent protease with chaperone function [Chthonomonas calidirosea]